MPIRAVVATATSQNGLGAFILPCLRLDIHYSDWHASSAGLNTLLANAKKTTSIPKLSSRPSSTTALAAHNSAPSLMNLFQKYPSTEFRVSPRPSSHPVLIAHYINGRTKNICVRNLTGEQIIRKAELLLMNSGTKNRMIRGKNVVSENEGVRGGWSALHGGIKAI